MKKIIGMLLLISVLIIQGCSGGGDDKEKEKDTMKEDATSEISITSTSIEVVEDKTIKVEVEAVGEALQYAYYVYKDDEVLEKIYYGKFDNQFEYEVEEEGVYKVRTFIRVVDGEKESKYTKEIEIEIEI